MKRNVLGSSTLGRPIESLTLTRGPRRILLLAGVHGDEPEAYLFLERFVNEGAWRDFDTLLDLHVVTRVNPDACEAKTRVNANGVDLNRNLPTRDWSPEAREARYFPGKFAGSEIENRVLMDLVETSEWNGIVSFHSWEPCINYNGPARAWAEVFSKHSGCRVTDHIGYPTPGSFGTWSGSERNIPTLTVEIQEKATPEDVWQTHARALVEGLKFAVTDDAFSPK